MSINLFQLIHVTLYVLVLFGFWKAWQIRSKQLAIFLVLIAIIMFFLNPFRFTQPGGSFIEKDVSRFEPSQLPEKVAVERPSFSERQQTEMLKLQQQSEGKKDEIHD